MRKIVTTTFVTLDGVLQAPGGPEEDPSEGFTHGGWQMGWNDAETGKVLHQFMTAPFELLLGKRTYELFSGYWPAHPEIELVATPFNRTRKYVVSSGAVDLSWNNSVLIGGDVPAQLRQLKTLDAPDLWVWGSGKLVQTLLQHNLIDRMHVWTFPLTLGTGKKLFAEGTQPQKLKLVDSMVSPSGVVLATYEPDGALP